MATSKPTTTEDIKADNGVRLNEAQAANSKQLEQIAELSDPNALADQSDQPKMTKVTSPLGSTTEVPESILQALLDSGYSKSK